MKKGIFILFCIVMFAVCSPRFASASEVSTVYPTSTSNEDHATIPSSVTSSTYGTVSNTVQICTNDNSRNMLSIDPQATCTSNGGYARIDYTAGSIRWEINPRFSVFYSFEGEITIRDIRGNYITSTDISGSNVGGLAISKIYTPNLSPGRYDAVITGSAWSTNGTISTVVPYCNVAFTIR